MRYSLDKALLKISVHIMSWTSRSLPRYVSRQTSPGSQRPGLFIGPASALSARCPAAHAHSGGPCGGRLSV